MTINEIISRLDGVKKTGAGYIARCPAHDDAKPSLSISEKDGKVLWHCMSGCSQSAVADAMGLNGKSAEPEAVYNYGRFRKLRYPGKNFVWQHKTASGWGKGFGAGYPSLYRAEQLNGQAEAFFVEGEKDTDTLRRFGLPAVCLPTTSQKAYKKAVDILRNKKVTVFYDNDEAGIKQRDAIVKTLQDADIAYRIVELPGLPDGGDVTDWLKDHSKDELLEIINKTKWQKPRIRVTCLADVEPEAIKWLWPNRLPVGMLSLLVGNPNAGKSFISMYITSQITTGRDWPDCKNDIDAGSVVIFGDEDSLSQAVRPRLDAHQANVKKVYGFDAVEFTDKDDLFSIREHIRLLSELIDEIGDVRLIIFDPITSYLRGIDANSNADVRGALVGLQQMAQRKNVAILGISHFSKKSDLDAIHRTLGSTAFTAAARSVWAVAREKVDDESDRKPRRLFMPVKSNYSIEPTGLAFDIIDGQVAFAPDVIDDDVDTAIRGGMQKNEDTKEAIEWLKGCLQYYSRPASEVYSEAKEAGFSKWIIQKAAKELDITKTRDGFGSGGAWTWKLEKQDDVPI